MKVFLVVVVAWEMAYRGWQIMPQPPVEMPSLSVCKSAGEAMKELSAGHGNRVSYRCIEAKP